MFYWKNKIAQKIRLGLINAEEGGDKGGGGNGDGDKGGGGDTGNYYDAFPADVQAWDEVKNSDSPDKFWQQITSHRTHLGNSVRIPGADAGEADIKAFHAKIQEKVPGLMQTPDFDNTETLADLYGKMGRPETAEDYKIPEFKNDEGTVIEGLDHTLTKSFMAIAHAQGLSQAQFAEVVGGVTAINLANQQLDHDNMLAQQELIKTEWGAATDQNYKTLEVFAKKTDAPAAVQKAIQDKTLDQATSNWMLAASKLSLKSGDRGIDDDSNNEGVMTPGEAKATHDEIMNNKKHAYWDKMNPGHKAAIARVRELIILQNPTTAKNPAPGTVFRMGGAQE